MQKILIATKNKHKVEEFTQMFPEGTEIISLLDFPDYEDIEETGTSFKENARIKARHLFNHTGITTIADDSGLEVIALDNRPGIYSARYSSLGATADENNALLLKELIQESNRDARFICHIVMVSQDGEMDWEGRLEGDITNEQRGEMGFGYDPLFIPKGYHQTLAELGPEIKNQISHRAIACQKLKQYLDQKI